MENILAVLATTTVLTPIIAGMSGAVLITNEFAYRHPKDPQAVISSTWDLTSGSLFRLPDGTLWTGVPDRNAIDPASNTGTDSAQFRAVTADRSYGDVSVALTLTMRELTSTPRTPQVAWDGVHIMIRYASQFNLYYASVVRRDGTIVMKKKCPGGPSNGGTYYKMTPYVTHPWQPEKEMHFKLTARNVPRGVQLQLFENGKPLLIADDLGKGIGKCPPITQPGGIGVRGDNAEFMFKFQPTKM